jgi:hypothetical protein
MCDVLLSCVRRLLPLHNTLLLFNNIIYTTIRVDSITIYILILILILLSCVGRVVARRASTRTPPTPGPPYVIQNFKYSNVQIHIQSFGSEMSSLASCTLVSCVQTFENSEGYVKLILELYRPRVCALACLHPYLRCPLFNLYLNVWNLPLTTLMCWNVLNIFEYLKTGHAACGECVRVLVAQHKGGSAMSGRQVRFECFNKVLNIWMFKLDFWMLRVWMSVYKLNLDRRLTWSLSSHYLIPIQAVSSGYLSSFPHLFKKKNECFKSAGTSACGSSSRDFRRAIAEWANCSEQASPSMIRKDWP